MSFNIDNHNLYLDHGDRVDLKRYNVSQDSSIKCKNCGHTIVPFKDRIICSYCGFWVYKNSKVEFKYKFKETLKKY